MSANTFPEYGSQYRFSEFETQVLKFWQTEKIFDRVLDQSKSGKTFFFYDGPPFATGLPHYGHILAGTIKDIVPRYWTMRGRHVARRFGWDTHGLPVEFEMEKTLKLNGSLDIQDYGIAKFNEACRSIVLRYTGEWRKTVERMGRWIDMDNDYKTMDPKFMESVWWVIKNLWDKGLIYEGKKVVPYSWRLTAPLSNFEASLNYKDVQDPAITVLMPVKDDPKTALAVWTTTPWTLPSNLAVAINADSKKVQYARYKLKQPVGQVETVIMGTETAVNFGLDEKSGDVANAELIGKFYEPLFTTYVDEDRKTDRAFRVIAADYVSATDGTGLVHQAPSFGEEDYYACQKEGIRAVDPTDMQASFTQDVARDARLKDIVGLFVKDADKAIIKVLKDSHRLLKQDTLQHAYPFCYRSDTPLIYKAISSWYVKIDAIKDRMIKNNQQIYWVPGHIKDGRFGKWLENARDWCISRNRFWGTPIPVWKCQTTGAAFVVGAIKDLEELTGREINDLHMHKIDDLPLDLEKVRKYLKGQSEHLKSLGQSGAAEAALTMSQTVKGPFKRTTEVLDCWFESGSMPYGQEHYPFENKEKFEESFPADFIAEGLDQTRGWFYTLTALSSALFDKPAFRHCIVNGMVLAEDGKKMSKSLKNYPDPNLIFDKYGADALRLYLMQSPAMHAEELRFSEKSLVELMRAVMLPLWNAYGFFSSYANIDGWKNADIEKAPKFADRPTLDRWISLRAKETEALVHQSMEAYRLSEVAPSLIAFIDDLTNWYIRLNRERYWAGNDGQSAQDKLSAYATLWSSLESLSLMLAPFLPFYADVLFGALHGRGVDAFGGKQVSVHEKRFREPKDLALTDSEKVLLEEFSIAKRAILLGRSLRGEVKIGLRQPLAKMRIAGLSDDEQKKLKPLYDLVMNEVNVKSIEIVANATDLVEESAKPNHRVLGKKVGKDMKPVQDALAKWGSAEIASFERTGSAEILGHKLSVDDIQIVRKAKEGSFAQAGFGLVAELDTKLSEALINEGLQREVINRIQQLRKERQLHLADRIQVSISASPNSRLHQVLKSESEKPGMISAETLCQKFELREPQGASVLSEDFGEHGSIKFDIQKI